MNQQQESERFLELAFADHDAALALSDIKENTPHEEGLRWLMQAEADRKGAQALFDAECFHLVCFLAQQITEKALKAYLYAQGEELVTGRSINKLIHRCGEYDSDYLTLRPEAAPLDGLYIPTRYPNAVPDSIPADVFTRPAAVSALEITDKVLDRVKTWFEKNVDE
ncbi:HEPN domain-containing protein [Methanospirillum stamsii]|uniref:DNA-binding protein n=1 Tax=Methanospirillum stamsii TaxID=1277351 RepID=A0A2V2NA83_9EURY|nr:HEPN domain-containing protein [Methanospirillum stamsii]PWR75505.1 DNA-binding protein [Methanospirillum stamsii]